MAKYNIVIDGQKTSISLESEFWDALTQIADQSGTTPHAIAAKIVAKGRFNNASSHVRVFVIEHFMDAARVATATIG